MKFSIGKKITGGFGLVIAIIAGVAGVNYFKINELRVLQDEGAARAADAVTIQEGVGMADKIYALAADAIITGEVNGKTSEWTALKKEVHEDLDAFEKSVDTDKERALVAEVKKSADKILRIVENDIFTLLTRENTAETIDKIQKANGLLIENMVTMEDGLTQIAESLSGEMTESDELFDETSGATVTLVLALSAIGLIFSIGVALAITRGITGPVGKIVTAAEGIALGDVDQDINVNSGDELGELARTFGRMIDAQKQKAHVAEQIAKGNLEVDAEVLSDKDTLGKSMNTMKQAIERLAKDAAKLSDAAVEGRLDVRADALDHDGEFATVINGVNQIVDTLVGHLDAMPAPAMIIDREYNIQYMNAAGAGILGQSQQQLIGQKCFNQFKTSDCNTQKCACNRAMQSGSVATSETDAHPTGMDLDIQYSGVPVKDLNGKIIGAFEVISDQTAVKRAARVAEKQSKFQAVEVKKLVANLGMMAEGNLNVSLETAATDADTAEIGKNFSLISDGLGQTAAAVRRLVDDANLLAEAAVEGKLDTRADISKHSGEYQRIVSGVNMTLDAVLDPINEAARVLEELASYNLTARVNGDYQGDHAKIKESLNATAIALHDSMAQVAEAADQVSSASTQIASSSQQVAEGTSEQASSLEETSSALEEMAGMTKQNADNTQQAKGLAESTRAAAVKGAGAMTNMLSSMEKIKQAAEGTAAIIKDINDIAFQTNLLALNAAVEAARAGDAGRGFAVVAEEVRNLAGRAKEAAKNTEELIKESVRLADEGQNISGQVNENLNEIVGSVGKVTDIVAEIAVASQEQARGIEQVNKAVTEMDKVVQQSAANSEESSSAAEELAGQSQEMAAMVGRFKLNRTVSGRGTKRQAAGPAKSAVKKPVKKSVDRAEPMEFNPEALIPLDTDPDFAAF